MNSQKRKRSTQNEEQRQQDTEENVDWDNIEIKDEPEDDTEPSENGSQTSKSTKKTNKRRGRIIVRNLSFQVTEEKLKKYYEEYGTVDEVKLLRKPDGKLVGCGFVQFQKVNKAAKAIYHTNGKTFMGRPLVCDWAVGKDTYISNMKAAMEVEIKEEDTDEIKNENDIITEDEIKDEPLEEEEKSDFEEEAELFHVSRNLKDNSESSSDEEKVEVDEDDEEDDEDEESNEEDEEINESKVPPNKKPKFESNDVSEGKTVFIKNVPFSATNKDLEKCMSQFGELEYALVCIDSLTEHPKGTAFVKYKNKEDADKCLEAGTELTLNDNILDCHRAISKGDLKKSNTKDDQHQKDSRNLYLVKEGAILAGSKAAQGVSAEDMAKRLDLERWKTQMLRNLNMFVSRDRLVVYNIPPTYTDQKLRQLFVKHSGPKCVIKEARIMRDLKNLDSKGVGQPKGYGFVAFTRHEDALKALRNINNNPTIFTKARRPIVAFSIENRSVLNARNKRLLKSKINNPNFKNREEIKKQLKIEKNYNKEKVNEEKPESDFVGTTAKPGLSKMRSKFKLKTQANLHREHLLEEKRKRKALKQKQLQRLRLPKQKQNKKTKKEPDNFSKLVNEYKSKILANTATKKSKWYET